MPLGATYPCDDSVLRRRPWIELQWTWHFDTRHMFLDMSDGPPVQFPSDWFPVLQAATAAERKHFAVPLDHEQIFWPETDEDVTFQLY
jgi:hypothetical protein